MTDIVGLEAQAAQQFNSGDHQGAEAAAREILRRQPGNAFALNLLGMIAGISGDLDSAAEYFRQALVFSPRDVDILSNLSEALRYLGKPAEALPLLREATAIAPGYPVIFTKLAATLIDLGLTNEALEACRTGLSASPGDPALNGLAADLVWRQQPEQALSHLHAALLRAPDSDQNWLRLNRLLRTACMAPTPENRRWLLAALSRPVIRPDEIAWSIGMTLQRDAVIAEGIARATAPGIRASDALADLLARLSADELLLSLMQATVIPSPQLERLFTSLRLALIRALDDPAPVRQDDGLSFCAALAIQAFHTDYAWSVSEEEDDRVRRLAEFIEGTEASASAAFEMRLSVLGCYRPLHELRRADELRNTTSWTANTAALIRIHVTEPLLERAIRERIPQLTPIDDPVSLRVRAQYEEHPYPRWIRAGQAPAAVTLSTLLRQYGGTVPSDPSFMHPDVLIAGCGTGMQSILAASRYHDANILAVDLSLASLAYASRKTREFGIGNIEYGQADILELRALGRQFHLIESGGVLHHLADPAAGWRVLADLLHPYGLMIISLYSETARRIVTAAREHIAEMRYSAEAADIRRCRRDLLALPEDHPFASLRQFRDFYNICECRDLLFHVQEHCFTLPAIERILAQTGLRFLGFFSIDRGEDYRLRFPDDPAMRSLANWHAFELEHPDTFAGMYHLLVQKT